MKRDVAWMFIWSDGMVDGGGGGSNTLLIRTPSL